MDNNHHGNTQRFDSIDGEIKINLIIVSINEMAKSSKKKGNNGE